MFFFFVYIISYTYVYSALVLMERQPRRINDFFRKKCIRWTGGGGGSVSAVGVAGQKEWLKKNLLVAMDIRRVEYPGGFFVFFFVCPVSSQPFNPIHVRPCPFSPLPPWHYYVRCVHNKNNFDRFNGRKLYRGFFDIFSTYIF